MLIMSRFLLEVQDVNDNIPKLASLFKIGYKQNLAEYTVLIPNSLGKGQVMGINFSNGISLYTYKCFFHEDVEIVIKNSVLNPIRMVHCLKGEITNSGDEMSYPVKIGKHQHFFIAPKSGGSHIISFPKKRHVELCYLEIDRSTFKNSLPFELQEVEPIFYSLFGDVFALQGKYHSGMFSLKVSEIIKEIYDCKETGFPRMQFMEAKALEILSFMLSRYRKEIGGMAVINITGREFQAVEAITEHINQNLSNLETIPELAAMIGINVNKLQSIFQSVFGKTVNEYIRDARLSKALTLLSKGDMPIGIIVHEVGLNSRSYFSKIFKEKYGVLPREIMSHESGFIPEHMRAEKPVNEGINKKREQD